jgi:hypothetical protein
MDHLLLHCEVVSALWSAFFDCFRFSQVMPRRVVELLTCWWSLRNHLGNAWGVGVGGGGGGGESTAVWKMVPTCFFWCLWREE